MTYKEALKRLDIEDYGERIFYSNSHGELFHLLDYMMQADIEGDVSWFRGWFEDIVKMAEEHWQRPKSVFQHIPKLLRDTICKESE